MSEVLSERNEKAQKDGKYEHVSLTKEGVVPKSERYERDFLVRDENKEYKITKLNDICYNPANLKFGVICRNKYKTGIFSPIYITYEIDDKYNYQYIEELLTRKDFINYALKFQQGTVYERMSVNSEDFLKIKVNIHTKKEQDKISLFLFEINKTIALQQQKIEHLKLYKQGVLFDILNKKIKFKDKDKNDYPKWQNTKFSDIFESFEYGLNLPAKNFDGENKYIRITDINEETHKYINYNPVSPNGILHDKYLVQKNDILFARTGASVGKTYIYNENDGKLYFAGFLIRGKVKKENNSNFIFQNTLTNKYNKWVKTTSMRSGQPGINSQEYENYRIDLPCLEEQNKIATFLESIDKLIEKNEEKLQQLLLLKRGLLQKMF